MPTSLLFLLLYHRLDVTLLIIDGDPLTKHATFSVAALMVFIGHHCVLGLTLETRFEGLTLVTHQMIQLATRAVKLTMTGWAIGGGLGPAHVILTIEAPAGRTAFPLTGMIGSVIGVEPPVTVHAIIGTVDKGRKRGTVIKMMVGFQQTNLVGRSRAFENQKEGLRPVHHRKLILGTQRLLELTQFRYATGTFSRAGLSMGSLSLTLLHLQPTL